MAEQAVSIDEAQLQKDVEHILIDGGCLADIRRITSDELDAVYAIAYTEYGQQQFEKAEKLFFFLCLYDHRQQKHWMGMASSRQQLENFEGAVQAYLMAGVLDPDDPLPPLQMGECFLAQGELEGADSALQLALHTASQDPRFARAKARAEALLTATSTRKAAESSHAD